MPLFEREPARSLKGFPAQTLERRLGNAVSLATDHRIEAEIRDTDFTVENGSAVELTLRLHSGQDANPLGETPLRPDPETARMRVLLETFRDLDEDLTEILDTLDIDDVNQLKGSLGQLQQAIRTNAIGTLQRALKDTGQDED